MSLTTLRNLISAIAVLTLFGCGEKTAEQKLDQLGEIVERQARGATMTRAEYLEGLEDFYAEDPGVVVSEPETHIRFRKWVCRGGGTRTTCKGEGAVPIDYLIRSAVVDPRSIKIAAPDTANGESGFAIEYRCTKRSSQDCTIFQRIGGVDNYTRCKDRDCSPEEARWEQDVEALAKARNEDRVEWIPCRSEDACMKAAAAFRDMISLATGRPIIRSEKEFRRAISHVSEALTGGQSREKFGEARTISVGPSSIKGADISYRTGAVRIDPDGRLHLEEWICANDSEAGCDDDAHWAREFVHANFADLDPGFVIVHDFADEDETGHENRDGVTLSIWCADREVCVSVEGNKKKRGVFIPIPCPDKDGCRAAEKQFEGLLTFAATDAGREMIETAAAQARAATSINNVSQARQTAKRISTRLSREKAIEIIGLFSDVVVARSVTQFEGENDLVISGDGVDCLENDCEATDGDAGKTFQTETRIDLARLDQATIKVSELFAEGVERSMFIECDDGRDCVEHLMGGVEMETDNSASLRCRSQSQCEVLAKDLRGLVAFARAEREPVDIDPSRAMRQYDDLIAQLKKHIIGARSATFFEEENEASVYQVDYLFADAEGNVHTGLLACSAKAVADCNDKSEWFYVPMIAKPDQLDHKSLLVQPFDKKGGFLGPPISPRWDDVATGADTFVIEAVCREGADCVDFLKNGKGEALYLPCSGEESCLGAVRSLLALSRFAASPAYATALEAHAARLAEAAPVTSEGQARKAAARLSKGLNGRDFFFEDGQSRAFQLTEQRISLDEDQALSIETQYDMLDENETEIVSSGVGETVVDLKGVDASTVRVHDPEDNIGWFVIFSCDSGTDCVVNKKYGDGSSSTNRWYVTCKDFDACEDAVRDLRGLAAFAVSGPASGIAYGDGESDDEITPDRRDETKSTEAAEAPRKLRRHLSAFNDATRNANMYIRAAEGPSLRKLQSLDASIDDDGHMIARRRVCLALLADNMRQDNECRLDTLFHPYDLEITLSKLDSGSVDVGEFDVGATGKGWWIKALCRKGEIACAQLLIPANPTHMRLQSETMMRSFLETETDPKIRIPCASERACKAGVKALRELIKHAPKSKQEKRTARRGGDIVGTWSFQSAYPTGWVIEFRKDGNYVFTMPNARIDGRYSAKNGRYELKARQPNSDDTGTYRLLDENTLELAGRLGVGVWRRVEED